MARQDARDGLLDNILIEMETLEHTFPKAIARYEYPFADGGDLDDLGQKTHTLKIRCYFWDDGASHNTFDAHFTLVNALAKKDDWTLQDPVYGSLKGKVENVNVRFNERLRTAEVDLDFDEQMRTTIAASPATDVANAVENSFVAGQDEQNEELGSDLVDLGMDPIISYDPDQSLLSQAKGFSKKVRGVMKEVDKYLAEFDATANQVLQPVSSLTSSLTFATTLPGRIIGTLTKCVERVARLYDTALDFPARFMGNLDLGLHQLADATKAFSTDQSAEGQAARALIAKHLAIASAQRLALESAYCYASDEDGRQQVRQAEKTPSFDLLGNFTGVIAPDIMNVRELEATLAAARTWLQSGIDQARSMQSLKDLALELLNHVSSVKLEREKIITIEQDNPLPLHLICLKYGLPYNYAERIVSINPQLANPNAAAGYLQIYTLPGGAA